MQDKEIRKILIEYLKIHHNEYRIYQEKSIGSSICDLMLVTDKLTGFEIKSDSDNYERLPRQIAAYNHFFDENYIVVGISHIKSIESRIPDEWGVFAVEEYEIKLIRKAKPNKSVSRLKQLALLWKIELKNILLQNKMPLYAQREKPFLCEKIAAEVDPTLLGKQIATELLERDYSIFDAEDYTIKSESNKENMSDGFFPASEMIDRLSEENLAEFTLDKWMAIYKQAVEKKRLKEEYVLRVEEENRVKQQCVHKIPYTDIEVSLGVPWVSAEIISQFAIEVFNVPQQYHFKIFDTNLGRYIPDKKIPIVQHEKITGYWHVEKYKGYSHPELVSIYGTQRFNAMQILECTLNLRQIKIHNVTKFDEAATIAAIEKQKVIQDAFKEWLWKDEDRRWEVEEAYNRIFSEYEIPAYDGSNIEFDGKNPDITLFDYQKNAVQKIISTPNTLLSFDVGAGKTYIMIAAAMEMRKSGLSRKNMFVVPNNIVGQWEKMFTDLYPKAKVLAVEPKSFTPEKRNKVLSQIQKEDYDGVIIAYSCFDMIPLSFDYLLGEMQDTIKGFESRINELRRINFPNATSSIQREAEYVKKTMDSLITCSGTSPTLITFNDLDINTLFVDEAHNFKNIPLRTSMKYIRGINAKGSNKCLAMLHKAHCVQANNGGRGVVFATGTPLCNSIADTYTMQCFLQYDELKAKGLERFDNWAKSFARVESVCEVDVDTSGFRIVERFKEFFNLPELAKMFAQISIFHNVTPDGLPNFLGYNDVVIEKGPELDAYMQKLYKRTENIRDKRVEKSEDNMLKVSTDGRKAALSLALVDEEQPYDEHCKIYHCIENVMDIYKKHEGCSQLIFCDYSTPQNLRYSVYKDLKARFIECGVPASEIAFIHSCKNEEQKVKLYDAVNSGKVRILMGSTFKLGIGANVQTKLKAIHHIDVPWRPADMVQREGRILRRGNENDEVKIYRYIVEGSFDSYSWQILQTKQHFISQFLSGNSTTRSIEDFTNDELNYAQVKALALSEPLMKEYVEKENALRNARLVLRQEIMQKESAKLEIKRVKEEQESLALRRERTTKNLEYVENNIVNLRVCFSSIAELITSQLGVFSPDREIAKIGEFSLRFPHTQSEKKQFLVFERLNTEYYVEFGDSVSGNKTRLSNFFEKFNNQVSNLKKRYEELEEKKENLKNQIQYCSGIEKKIEKLEEEKQAIFDKISIKKVD